MKQWKYAWGWKAAALVINQICAVAMVISVALCTIYVGSEGIGLLRHNERFEDTEYYQTEVREQIYRCIRAASRESKFENRGVSDVEMLVNLQDYVRNDRILPETGREGVYYKLKDLLEWADMGYAVGEVVRIEYQDGRVAYSKQDNYTQITTNIYEDGGVVSSTAVVTDSFSSSYGVQGQESVSVDVSDLEENYATETVSEESVSVEVQNESANNVDMYLRENESPVVRVDTIEAVEEYFSPEGYEGLIAYAQANHLNADELQGLYNNLQEIIPAIYNDYYAYEQNLELFSPDMTNMRYMIIPVSAVEISSENFQELTYTNFRSVKKGLRGIEDFLHYFHSYPNFLIYNTEDMAYEHGEIPISMGEVSNYLKGYRPSVEGGYILAIAIDPEYQASDNLQAYKEQFEELRPVSQLAFYGLFLGSVLYFLSLVYLTLAAGHQASDIPGSTVVHLTRFDKIKTELGALLVCVPAAGVVALCVLTLDSLYDVSLVQYAVVGACYLFVLNLLFLWGYLSLARRVKGHVIWNNSILNSILKFCNAVVANRKMTTRAILEYLLFLAANCILLCFDLPGFFAACAMDAIVGVVILLRAIERQKVLDGIYRITQGELEYQIPVKEIHGETRVFAEAVNNVGEGLAQAVAKSVKDEKLKSDLITNVSHDIKTPLTSIINYVDLLKREEIPGTKANSYIAILEEKAHRLKHLTEALVEASKISSGNITLELMRIHFQEILSQTNGEFYERFEARGLKVVTNMPEEPVVIEADGRRLWRILENIYSNVSKYAMPGTRVYVDMAVKDNRVQLDVKNISEQPLNIDASELTERFIRGDVSRNTEGSGLGLSIAKNLTQLQKGTFEIYLDGDLFRVSITFPLAPERKTEKEVVRQEKDAEKEQLSLPENK